MGLGNIRLIAWDRFFCACVIFFPFVLFSDTYLAATCLLDHAKSCENETKILEILIAASVLFFCPFHLFCQQLFL